MKIFKFYLLPAGVTAASFALGLLFGDYCLGPLCLSLGFCSTYFSTLGLWQSYPFGIGFSLVYGVIGLLNGLYGLAIFSILTNFPIQIYGLVSWIRHKTNRRVEVRALSKLHAFLLVSGIFLGSFVLGLLLDLIPSQQFAFLDSTSQIINLGGLVLCAMRYQENWYVYFANNTLDLIIWALLAHNSTPCAQLTLITSIMFFIMNIIGIIGWIKLKKKQKFEK